MPTKRLEDLLLLYDIASQTSRDMSELSDLETDEFCIEADRAVEAAIAKSEELLARIVETRARTITLMREKLKLAVSFYGSGNEIPIEGLVRSVFEDMNQFVATSVAGSIGRRQVI